MLAFLSEKLPATPRKKHSAAISGDWCHRTLSPSYAPACFTDTHHQHAAERHTFDHQLPRLKLRAA
jgi:hypothetical protein